MELNQKEQEMVDLLKGKITQALDERTETLQKQMDLIFAKFETSRPANKGYVNTIERKAANEWLKKFFKKQLETKESGISGIDYMATDPDASGGVLVPELLLAEIQHCVAESGMARLKMRYMPFSGAGNTRRIPKEIGSIQVQWVDEGGKKPVSNLVLDEVILELKKLAVISIMTEELVEDSAVDLVNFVAKRIADAITEEEDRVFFAGDTLLGDPFNGIINTVGVVPVFLPAGLTVEDITADDLLNMIYSVSRTARRGAEFYFSSDVMYHIRKLRVDLMAPGDGLGGYLVNQPTSAEPPSIWGYPVNIVDQLPDSDLETAEAPFAIFGNLQRTCFYADKNQLRIKLLTESTVEDGEGNQIHLAQQDAVALRVFKRVGFVVALPQCIAVLHNGEAGIG